MSIILDKVNYVYSEGTAYQIQALKDVNLTIEDGQFIGVIGHTGSGKSTLIQHLNGLMKATSGTIYFHGQDIYEDDFDLRELRNRVGLVFQYPEHQLFETDVITDVCFGPKKSGTFTGGMQKTGGRGAGSCTDFQRKCMKNRRLNSPEVRNVVLRLPVCLP